MGNIHFVKDNINNLLYIRSTLRYVNERFKARLIDVNKYPNFKLYQAVREYGHEHLHTLLIEQIHVDTVKQLREHEGQHIRLTKSSFNKNIAGRDAKHK